MGCEHFPHRPMTHQAEKAVNAANGVEVRSAANIHQGFWMFQETAAWYLTMVNDG